MSSVGKMPLNFFIVHGTLGNPEGNWFPWLKRELEANGHKVISPIFPTPEDQSFTSWLRVAKEALKGFDPAKTILIGHSIGAIFVLRMAEKSEKAFRAVFSVCPFVHDLGLDSYDALNATFIEHVFDWTRIKKNAGEIFCFAGKDDPYVPLSYAAEVADYVSGSLTVVEKGGHLNAKSGYLNFLYCLKKFVRLKEPK